MDGELLETVLIAAAVAGIFLIFWLNQLKRRRGDSSGGDGGGADDGRSDDGDSGGGDGD